MALFSIEGCILKNSVDTRKTSIMAAFQSSRTVGIAGCKLKLIIFIMFKVQVQLSRKHKYHNYSTKNMGCSRDTSYLSNSPIIIILYFNLHAVAECEGQLAVRSHGCFLDHQPPELFIELVNHHVSFFKF